MLGYQPGVKILGQLFLTALQFEPAQCRPDEINEDTARLAVGTPEVVLVKIISWGIQSSRQRLLLLRRQGFSLTDLVQNSIVLYCCPDGALPVRDVFLL